MFGRAAARRWSDGVAGWWRMGRREQSCERGLPGPGLGQVQRDPAGRACQAGWDVDEGAADRRCRGFGESTGMVGDETGSTGEVECDHGEHEPGAVRGEHSGGQVREWAVLQVGVDLLDDRVSAVSLVRRNSVESLSGRGGEERVVPVGVEQGWLVLFL